MTTKAELSTQIEAQAKQIADLQRQLQYVKWSLEGEQSRLAELVGRDNAVCGMIEDVFGFKVYAAPCDDWHSEPEWVIEDKVTGEVLVERRKPLAAAYYAAIIKRLMEGELSETLKSLE